MSASLLAIASCVGPPTALRAAAAPLLRRRLGALLMSTDADKAARKAVGLPKAIAPAGGADDAGFLRASARLPAAGGPFTVLGIETSCDDTGAAVVRSDGAVLGEALASQAKLHEEWGGVVPGIARDAHEEALERVVGEALRSAGLASAADVDAVAVTVGPGLEICLRVGTEGAKALALEHDKVFVGVHHLEAHVMMARLVAVQAAAEADASAREGGVEFPFLTLLTSGGHCQLLLTRGVGQHAVLGSTLDDALGEAFDKVARLLGLPIGGGGGPALEALARAGDPASISLPVPMRAKKNLDFSFAGLKTAVRRAVERTPEEERGTERFRADVAASFQHAAFSHLEQRLKYAMQYCATLGREAEVSPAEPAAAGAPRTLVVSGGVAANQELKRRLQQLCDSTRAPGTDEPWRLVVPPPRLCTDNGVMVAWAAVEALAGGSSHEAEGQQVRARWPLGRAVGGAALPPGGVASGRRVSRRERRAKRPA